MKNLLHDVIFKINIWQWNSHLLLYGICMLLLIIAMCLVICHNLTQMFNRRCASPGYQCANLREVTTCVVWVCYGHIYIIVVALYLIYGSCLWLIIITNLLSEILSKVSEVCGESLSIEMLGGSGGAWILTPCELYIKDIRALINTKTTEYNQFIYDKIILHQLKQINSHYKNIEIISLPNFDDYARLHYCISNQNQDTYMNMQEKFSSSISRKKFPPGVLKQYYQLFLNQYEIISNNWRGVPDAVFFNKDTKNMITVQYKSSWGENLEHFESSEFFERYNNNTHIMSILLKNPDKYSNLINVINKNPHNFDIWLKVGDNNIHNALLLEMEQMNDEFMIEQGDDILHKLYFDFYTKDYSKLKVDEIFLQDFYKCMKFYNGEQNFTTLIKNTKTDV